MEDKITENPKLNRKQKKKGEKNGDRSRDLWDIIKHNMELWGPGRRKLERGQKVPEPEDGDRHPYPESTENPKQDEPQEVHI